jgi:hypothetical protein
MLYPILHCHNKLLFHNPNAVLLSLLIHNPINPPLNALPLQLHNLLQFPHLFLHLPIDKCGHVFEVLLKPVGQFDFPLLLDGEWLALELLELFGGAEALAARAGDHEAEEGVGAEGGLGMGVCD